MNRIKSCPFCGCINLAIIKRSREYFIHCTGCDTIGPSHCDANICIDRWNTRVGKAEVTGLESVDLTLLTKGK